MPIGRPRKTRKREIIEEEVDGVDEEDNIDEEMQDVEEELEEEDQMIDRSRGRQKKVARPLPRAPPEEMPSRVREAVGAPSSTGERFIVQHVPEQLGIVDTLKGEAVCGSSYPPQAKPEIVAQMESTAFVMNQNEKIQTQQGY